MKKEELETRIQELAKNLNETIESTTKLKTTFDNTLAHQHAIMGRLEEARFLHQSLYGEEAQASS